MPGWKELIVCGRTTADPCGYEDLIELAQNLITDLVILSTLMAVVIAVWIGFQLILSQGNENALKASKHAAWSLLKGYIVILVAWLVVYTLIKVLFNDGYSILGNPQPTNTTNTLR